MTTDQSTTLRTEPAPLAEVRNDLAHHVRATWVVTRRELLRFKQDRARMLSTLLQPVLFIFVMGTGLGTIVDTGGDISFKTFLFPGVLATSVLFTAAFAGVSLVWDREFGFLREMMVAPISRASIIWGKCLGGAIVATGQSLILLALVGTVGIPYDPLLLLALIGCLFLGSLFLTALGVLLSTRIKTIQGAMPMLQLLRHLVLAHLDMTAAEQARLLPALTWAGWPVPIGVQLLTVAVITLGLIGVSARMFRTTE
jgi:ABC-2 type transport system permease protein